MHTIQQALILHDCRGHLGMKFRNVRGNHGHARAQKEEKHQRYRMTQNRAEVQATVIRLSNDKEIDHCHYKRMENQLDALLRVHHKKEHEVDDCDHNRGHFELGPHRHE